MNLTVSTEEAAAMLGMSTQSIRKLVLQGELHPVETPHARKYRVSLWSVLKYLGLPEEAVNSIFAQHLGQASCSGLLSPVEWSDPASVERLLSSVQLTSAGGKMQRLANHGTAILEYLLSARPCPTSPPPRTGGPDRRVSASMARFDSAARRAAAGD